MAMVLQPSSIAMFSFKVFLIVTSVLSAAIMLKFYFPEIAEFAVYELPSVYNAVISWLRPPYLYLVLNCIIITIVASSKLQLTKDDVSTSPQQQPVPAMDAVPLVTQPVTEVKISQTDCSIADSSDRDRSAYDFKVEKGSDCDGYEVVEASLSTKLAQTASSVDAAADDGVVLDEDVSSSKENKYVNSKSSLSTTEIINKSSEHRFSKSKPPVSARFGHRRNVKSSPEGGWEAAALGVSRPKRNDTLESTWKTITEGRPAPLTRNLGKADTWERNGHSRPPSMKMMTKSETFQERGAAAVNGGGKLVKKEGSLSEEELNKRVEAFINKFNEEMRLQRQESLNQYMEMVQRGSH